jgi:NAD(P)-dependent dehydrogenase (short-subunit alcohol dehydrogenase family)
MVKTFDLSGKIILITGGYGYLGKAITESLIHHGGTVFVLARSKAKFDAAFQNHDQNGEKLFFTECDIADTESIKDAFRQVNKQSGGIDALINNAVYLSGQNPLAMSDKDWENGIDGTLNSVFRCIREVIPYLKSSSAPRIINVSSMYGMVAPDFSVYEEHPEYLNPPHYGAAKAGVAQLSRYYASFLGKEGITVNTVTPGPFPPHTIQESKSFIEKLSEKTVLKRIGKPEEIAGAFVFLVSDTSSYLTGQNIVVDGGWTIG